MAQDNDTLRAARIAKGLSQVALAALTNVAQTTISAYESGILVPSPDVLQRMMLILCAPDAEDLGYKLESEPSVVRCQI